MADALGAAGTAGLLIDFHGMGAGAVWWRWMVTGVGRGRVGQGGGTFSFFVLNEGNGHGPGHWTYTSAPLGARVPMSVPT